MCGHIWSAATCRRFPFQTALLTENLSGAQAVSKSKAVTSRRTPNPVPFSPLNGEYWLRCREVGIAGARKRRVAVAGDKDRSYPRAQDDALF